MRLLLRLRPGQAVVEVPGGDALYRGCPAPVVVALFRTAAPPSTVIAGVIMFPVVVAFADAIGVVLSP